MIKELAHAFIDGDGNYIRDFQTTRFNSRLWELYLFAFLCELRFPIFEDFKGPECCDIYGFATNRCNTATFGQHPVVSWLEFVPVYPEPGFAGSASRLFCDVIAYSLRNREFCSLIELNQSKNAQMRFEV
jgi:hypothetical protein